MCCSSFPVTDLEVREGRRKADIPRFSIDCHLYQAVEQRIREEQRMMDEKIVLELDQKVIDQQSTLEKAGVSGFYITTNPQVGVWAGSVRSGSTLVSASSFV